MHRAKCGMGTPAYIICAYCKYIVAQWDCNIQTNTKRHSSVASSVNIDIYGTQKFPGLRKKINKSLYKFLLSFALSVTFHKQST